MGESPQAIRHFMEIRGIGIIDISALYGAGAIRNSRSWTSSSNSRTGSTARLTIGSATNKISIRCSKPNSAVRYPRQTGRNLSIILEVVARNHRLKTMGFSALEELNNRIRSNTKI
ncbi:MAG: hypothetical protein ACLUSP_10060 [Christensenellales bacterium]